MPLSHSFQAQTNYAKTLVKNIRESSPVLSKNIKVYIFWLITNNAYSEKDNELFKYAKKTLSEQHCDLIFIQKAKRL